MSDLIAIQINGSPSIAENLEKLDSLLGHARPKPNSPALAVLPECAIQFACCGATILENAENMGQGPIQARLANMAQKHNVYLVGGTMPIKSNDSAHYYAASLVFSPAGKLISAYNKIHLFDVEVQDKTQSYLESKFTQRGEHIATFDSPWGKVGQAICYDLRFATMFDAMMPMNIVVIPSAFTKATGQAHWHALLKARSIELQCYIVAANQVGTHQDGRETFGHSCIYSPWGELLSVIENEEGWASARVDSARQLSIRKRMPMQSHKRERYKFE
ncbi:carbon-nitrogen hydrolase family protein [Glaciecola sp. SC05]|uniref:carbon-nitrogen hydrolase family protein n=1 Tax=Glaciecola sp. SC05 TaxID=1987355 RepID=UPI0035289F05